MTATYGFDEVNISFLRTSTVAAKHTPLLITPRWDDSLEFLCKFLEINRHWVAEQILRYGAILIRDFGVENAVDFEKAVSKLQPHLCNAYRGTSPRSLMAGTEFAFSAADVPVNYPIAQHLEMSFLNAPPRNLYFGCLEASSASGGETSLCTKTFLRHYEPNSATRRSSTQECTTSKANVLRMMSEPCLDGPISLVHLIPSKLKRSALKRGHHVLNG